MRPSRKTAIALLAATALLPAHQAWAGGFGNRLQSTVGVGNAFAGAGTTPFGLSGMFWNPAAVNTVAGFESSSNYTLVMPQADIEAQDGTSLGLLTLNNDSGDVTRDSLVPASYLAYRLNPAWAIGLSINTPFGLTTKPEHAWSGQNMSITAKAWSVDVAAVVGYTVNDWLSVAAGPRVVYAKAKFSRDLIPPLFPGDASVQDAVLEDLDDYGFGWTAGATIKPWAGGEIALGYRSRVDLELEGDLKLPAVPPPIVLPLPAGVYPVRGKITLPDQATVSFSQVVSPQWTLLGSVEWKNWSLVQDVPFIITDGPAAGAEGTRLTFRYKDGWNFALGAEYKWNDQLTLRGGASYEISPIKNDQRDVSIPDSDRIWVSAGASYAFNENLTFDFGYSHGFVKDADIKVGAIVNPKHGESASFPGNFVGEVSGSIDVVSLGFRYKFGGPAVAEMPAQPISAKY